MSIDVVDSDNPSNFSRFSSDLAASINACHGDLKLDLDLDLDLEATPLPSEGLFGPPKSTTFDGTHTNMERGVAQSGVRVLLVKASCYLRVWRVIQKSRKHGAQDQKSKAVNVGIEMVAQLLHALACVISVRPHFRHVMFMHYSRMA